MPSITIAAAGTRERYGLNAAIATLGRGLECDIRLKDLRASRRHCQIVKLADGFKLVDLGSGNGTLLNGVQVKEQKLKAGDQIQIGSTVITFEDGARTQTATIAKPAAGNGRPGTQTISKSGTTTTKTGPMTTAGTGRLTTPQRPTAAITGKTTKTQIRTGTSKVTKKSPTLLSRAATGRLTTRRQTAVEKFQQEAGKKKTNPLVVIGAGAGLVLVAIVVVVFILPQGVHPREVKRKVETLQAEMGQFYKENRFDEARAKCREGIQLAREHGLRSLEANLQATLSEIDQFEQGIKELEARWEKFIGWYQNPPEPSPKPEEFKKEAEAIKSMIPPDFSPVWAVKLQDIIATLEKMRGIEIKEEQAKRFEPFRVALKDRFKLDDPDEADYGEAIRVWREEYLKTAPPEDERRARFEINNLETRANELKRKAIAKAERTAASDGPARAREYLDGVLKRLRGTPAEADVREELKKYP